MRNCLSAFVALILAGCAHSDGACDAEEAWIRRDVAAIPDVNLPFLGVALNAMRYEGQCACPADKAADGSVCGDRSAYSRGGGQALLCFHQNVRPEHYPRIREALAYWAASTQCGGGGRPQILTEFDWSK